MGSRYVKGASRHAVCVMRGAEKQRGVLRFRGIPPYAAAHLILPVAECKMRSTVSPEGEKQRQRHWIPHRRAPASPVLGEGDDPGGKEPVSGYGMRGRGMDVVSAVGNARRG